jgi:Xaa-Pro aminopeptidase
MFEQRLETLRAQMTKTGTDLVVVGPSSHMVWLAGVSPHGDERPVMLFVSQTQAAFLIPALNADSVRQHTKLPFFPWSDGEGPLSALAAMLKSCGAMETSAKIHVAIDETMRADFALLVLDHLPSAKRSFLHETIGLLRSRKDESEYTLLKMNALINDGAMQAGFDALETGISELEVADVIRAYYLANEATPEFVSVCFGENGAYPHHHTGPATLKPGSAVLIDIGGRSLGYPSDMTRVGIFGSAPEGFEQIHGIVDQAVKAALAAAKPGVTAKTVDQAARDVIAKAGYGGNFLHRTGHGLGIDVHERPYIAASEETILEEGNVFSIEPGIYLPGRFGIRLEEIVILRADHAEVLSELPRTTIGVSV